MAVSMAIAVDTAMCYCCAVNFMLFQEDEWGRVLPLTDHRAAHCRDVLGLNPGDTLKVACLGLGTGIATVRSLTEGLDLVFPTAMEPPESPLGMRLILGHVRPLVMQRLFKDLASLGIASIWVVNAGLTESSYFKSSFWAKNEYQHYLLEGAMQGGLARLPEIQRFYTLDHALSALEERDIPNGEPSIRLACHPGDYPPLAPIFSTVSKYSIINLAIGPERGWNPPEIESLLAAGFTLHSLGPRILRTELVAASLGVLRAMAS